MQPMLRSAASQAFSKLTHIWAAAALASHSTTPVQGSGCMQSSSWQITVPDAGMHCSSAVQKAGTTFLASLSPG